ncbi:formin-2-like [Lagopus muta]|uniref:formin-2-like n=1 Tax=Lagopus muta TaxID=64668 RepID=UPI0020A0A13F|nr:formin-2-like [Lagopus muta]
MGAKIWVPSAKIWALDPLLGATINHGCQNLGSQCQNLGPGSILGCHHPPWVPKSGFPVPKSGSWIHSWVPSSPIGAKIWVLDPFLGATIPHGCQHLGPGSIPGCHHQPWVPKSGFPVPKSGSWIHSWVPSSTLGASISPMGAKIWVPSAKIWVLDPLLGAIIPHGCQNLGPGSILGCHHPPWVPKSGSWIHSWVPSSTMGAKIWVPSAKIWVLDPFLGAIINPGCQHLPWVPKSGLPVPKSGSWIHSWVPPSPIDAKIWVLDPFMGATILIGCQNLGPGSILGCHHPPWVPKSGLPVPKSGSWIHSWVPSSSFLGAIIPHGCQNPGPAPILSCPPPPPSSQIPTSCPHPSPPPPPKTPTPSPHHHRRRHRRHRRHQGRKPSDAIGAIGGAGGGQRLSPNLLPSSFLLRGAGAAIVIIIGDGAEVGVTERSVGDQG